MKVKLTKILSNHENLRTGQVDGFCDSLPSIGNPFVLMGEGLDFGVRLVVTSAVESIYLIDKNKTRNLFHFKTKNSEYSLEVYSGP